MAINGMAPAVSVRLMTYNHEKYIARAIDSVLKQRTDFPVEVVIGDDFSTDGTPAIIDRYKKQFPGTIVVLNRPHGGAYDKQRKRLGRIYNYYDIIQHCSGNYIALLDGDDYWTDPLKLQQQYDFLESNPEYAFCSHAYSVVNQENEVVDTPDVDLLDKQPDGFLIDMDRFFDRWVTKSSTTVVRRGKLCFDFEKYSVINDYVLFYLLLQQQNGYWLNLNGCNYLVHEQSVYSCLPRLGKVEHAYKTYAGLYKYNRQEPRIKKRLIRVTRKKIAMLMSDDSGTDNSSGKLAKYAYELLLLMESKTEALGYIYNQVVSRKLLRMKMNARSLIDREYRQRLLEKRRADAKSIK